ncbi:hypothetical protein GWI68_19995 [Proteus sp. G2669]|uniref:hypothetical protein n=1 Tax=unclassified Proteus (in: enterobacteria) TaxID=257482 RepID=UPI001412C06C|nr:MULTISPECIES: hypothetical protein [unclassified Proteus (in: enterobacteria)]NBM56993.1 hypothetical protein [Proteus sp. G2669]UDN37593.1 hypothetical protein LG402_08095 [Proteus sp. NMG38-2]
MTDTQNSYKDEYTILSGTNKEAVFTKNNQKIYCKGTQATIISTGNEVELVDNYSGDNGHFKEDHVGDSDTLHGDNSFFISTGNDVKISAGKNSHSFATGDRSDIDYNECSISNSDNLSAKYNFGKVCAVITGNESRISSPDHLEKAILLSTGDDNQIVGFKGTNSILAGNSNIFETESFSDKSVINYGKDSKIIADGGVFIDLGENTKIHTSGEAVIFTKPGAEIEVFYLQEEDNSVIITAYFDEKTWLSSEDNEVSRIVQMYHCNIDFFAGKTYKVGEKGELIDITPTK